MTEVPHRSRRARLVQCVLAAMLAGCSGDQSSPEWRRETPVVVSISTDGVHEVPDLSTVGYYVVQSFEKHRIAELMLNRDSRRVVLGPAVLESTPMTILPGDRVDLRPPVSTLALNDPDTWVEVTLETNYPLRTFAISVPFPEVEADLVIEALPEDVLELRTRIETEKPLLQRAAVRVVELEPQPAEYWLAPIRAGSSTRFNASLGNASNWNNPIRCTVDVVADGVRASVFDNVLTFTADTGWHEISIPLTAYAGKEIQLVLGTDVGPDPNAYASDSEGRIAPVWADLKFLDTPPSPSDPETNLILISLDTVRADHLGCYGYEKPTSPNLDAFAAEATLFERCEASTSWTLPSHAAVFTGIDPLFQYRGAEHFYRMSEDFVTLAELARGRGYLAAGFCEGVLVSADRGFAQGFGRYWEGPGYEKTRPGSSEETFTRAREWLDSHGDYPFFLFVHTYEPHEPYEPPQPYAERFGAGIEKPASYDSKVHFEYSRVMYDGEIAHVDFQLGAFFDYLRERGLLERTHVIVMSDHGEEFGEHGLYQHMKTLYDESLHVPLIVRTAGAAQPGRRIPQDVALIDVFATAADLLGVDSESGVHSQSLMPLIRPGDGGAYERPYVASSLRHLFQQYIVLSVRQGHQKYIAATPISKEGSPLPEAIAQYEAGEFVELDLVRMLNTRETPFVLEGDLPANIAEYPGAREMLFDLQADPTEQVDRAATDSETAVALRRELIRLLETLEASGAVAQGEPQTHFTEQDLRELEAMGYLE